MMRKPGGLRLRYSHSIGNIIILCMTAGIAIILAFGGLVLLDTRNQVEQEVSRSELKMLSEASDKLDLLLEEMRGISDTLYVSRTIKQILQGNNLTPAEKAGFYDSFLSTLRSNYPWIGYEIYLFDLKGFSARYSIRSSTSTNLTWQSIHDEGVLDRILERRGSMLWVNGDEIDPEHYGSDYFLMNTVFDQSYVKPIGVSIIAFKKQYISRIFDFKRQNSTVSIVDHAGRLVSGNPVPAADLSGILGGVVESGVVDIAPEGERTLLIYHKVSDTGLYLVETIPAASLFQLKDRVVGLLLLFLALILLSTGVFYAYVITGIYRPINRLLTAMRQVEEGRLEAGGLDTGRADEIGRLNRGFERMMERLAEMFRQVEREQEEKRRAEIQMLQAQINPHFIYNTLNSIRCMIDLDGADTAKEMLIALVQHFKSMLRFGESFVTVEEELRTIKAYLFIQNCRFNNFHADYDVAETVLGCSLPRLLLQPIVENCIQHGFAEREDGRILIKIDMAGDDLAIDVTDNGEGIPEEELREILSGLYQPAENSIGLKNIYQRLQLFYPGRHVMEIKNLPQGGVRVSLRIPRIRIV